MSEDEAFNVMKAKDKPKMRKAGRDRSESSMFQEIIDGINEPAEDEIRHDFEEYENLDIDDLAITLVSINEIADLNSKVKGGVDAVKKIAKQLDVVREKKRKIEKALNSSKYIRSRDRVFFVYFSLLLHMLVYFLGSSPSSIFIYLSAATLAGFVVTRGYLYDQASKFTQIFNFPYYAAILLTLLLLHFPDSEMLYLFCFVSANGCLIACVYVLRQSLIMHKIEKIVDLVMYLFPSIVMWNLHWNLRGTPERQVWGYYDPSGDGLSWGFVGKLVWQSTALFLVWAIPFYLIFPVESQKYGEIRVVAKMAKSNAKMAVFGFQFVTFVIFAVTLGMLTYFVQIVHIMEIVLFACISFWYGGKYYMEYFGRQYDLKISSMDQDEKSDKKDDD